MRFNFLGPTNALVPVNVDAERSVNCYPEITAPGTPKVPLSLLPTPGRRIACTVEGETRIEVLMATGNTSISGRVFGLAGTSLFELTASGDVISAVIRGAVVASTGGGQQSTISWNGLGGNQLFITSGGYGYIYDLLADTLTLIGDMDFPQGTAACGVFLDGYFIVLNSANSSFQLSALFDGTSWNALDVAQRSNAPDDLVSLAVYRNDLWLFGELSAEAWYDSGASTFPFAYIQGSLMQIGVIYPRTIQVLDNMLWFLGRESTQGGFFVYRAIDYNPQRISTHAIEDVIRAGSNDTLLAWTYQETGHSFYVLRLDGRAAVVYDEASQLWHERGPWDDETEDFITDDIGCHVFGFGKHLVGDRNRGTIYSMSAAYYNEQIA